MRTALIINPHSLPERSRFERINPLRRDSFEDRLAEDVRDATGEEVSLYRGAENLDEVPDRVLVYGGDGSVMMAYNRLLELTDAVPPILIVGGGSGTYWTRNLGMQNLRRRDRLALLEKGSMKSFPLLRVEYEGEMSPHDVSYADSFGAGDLASWIHDAESRKGDWKSSQKRTRLERATYVFLSYIIAGAEYLGNIERKYYITTDEGEEVATIHGSILPMAGLGIRLYNPDGGFSVQSTPVGPRAHLTTLVDMAGRVVGIGDETVKQELTLSTRGTVPMHFNGSPFTFRGESISFTYEPNKVSFFCP